MINCSTVIVGNLYNKLESCQPPDEWGTIMYCIFWSKERCV